jgi:hypothetical protein
MVSLRTAGVGSMANVCYHCHSLEFKESTSQGKKFREKSKNLNLFSESYQEPGP